jgi:excisionase family DNA binding protein
MPRIYPGEEPDFTSKPEPKYDLWPHEAAIMLGTNPKFVRLLANQGKLSCTRTKGGHRRYNKEEVEHLFLTLPAPERR